MKRPRKPGMYQFKCTKKFRFPLSIDEWVVGIVFKGEDGRWSYHGVAGCAEYAHGFSWPLAPFVGNGEFKQLTSQCSGRKKPRR